jgi:hypothetical protein
MPCRDYYDDHPQQYYADTVAGLKKQISFAESALCAALNALEHVDSLVETVAPKQGDFYDWLAFEGAGIKKKEVVEWHTQHKILDAKHRAEEDARAREYRIRNSALAKLSAEERKVLGVK